MSKTQKGTTLVEVLVAIAVFSIISVAMFTSFLGMRRMVAKQEEYLHFDMICRDIAFYGEKYGRQWDEYYFSDEIVDLSQENGTIYFDYNYTPSTNEQIYCFEYSYVNGELIISIYHNESGRVIIDKLNYGGGRYVVK